MGKRWGWTRPRQRRQKTVIPASTGVQKVPRLRESRRYYRHIPGRVVYRDACPRIQPMKVVACIPCRHRTLFLNWFRARGQIGSGRGRVSTAAFGLISSPRQPTRTTICRPILLKEPCKIDTTLPLSLHSRGHRLQRGWFPATSRGRRVCLAAQRGRSVIALKRGGGATSNPQ